MIKIVVFINRGAAFTELGLSLTFPDDENFIFREREGFSFVIYLDEATSLRALKSQLDKKQYSCIHVVLHQRVGGDRKTEFEELLKNEGIIGQVIVQNTLKGSFYGEVITPILNESAIPNIKRTIENFFSNPRLQSKIEILRRLRAGKTKDSIQGGLAKIEETAQKMVENYFQSQDLEALRQNLLSNE